MPEASTIRVAVGTLRAPKLNALRSALDACGPWLQPNAAFEIAGFEVPSDVRSTPLSRLETMQGAHNRANALRHSAHQRGELFHYLVGLEGGLEIVTLDGERRVFLESWAYVVDAGGQGHYGQSGGITLPDDLARRVVVDGIDLSEAVDAFAGLRGIRDGLGAWGILTRGLITREDAFRIAAINAFSPFFKSRSTLAATP